MGLELNNVHLKKYKTFSLFFHPGVITAIQSDSHFQIMKAVKQCDLLLNGYFLSQDYIEEIAYISNKNIFFYGDSIRNEFHFMLYLHKKDKNDSYIEDIMSTVELDISLDRKISTLSSTEKYLLNIARYLLVDCEVFIFDQFFVGLDLKYRKLLKTIVSKLKNQGKIVILLSEDSNMFFEMADYVYLFSKGKLIASGNVDDVYTDAELLEKSLVQMPELCLLTYKAKKEKNVKLFYYKDVRDVMKDIYKHV